MNAGERGRTAVSPGYLAALALILTAGVLLIALSYYNDNKYTWPGKRAAYGVLLEPAPAGTPPLRFLAEGWEFYQYRQLTPDDFAREAPVPDAYVYLNQYGGFELGDPTASPHGTATYRLNIFPEGPRAQYALELPEIFSAYRLWINGTLMAECGADGLRAETFNGAVSFSAQERIEIVVAVYDASHFYSGMVYPPAFGGAQEVNAYLTSRIVLRAVVCAAALLVGLLQLVTGLYTRRYTDSVLYVLLCLSFVGYICYPLVHSLAVIGVKGWYMFENFSYFASLLLLMLLQRRICGISGRASVLLAALGGVACAASLIVPGLLMGSSLAWMTAYSRIVAVYKLWVACYLVAGAAWALRRGRLYSHAMLAGLCLYALALFAGFVLPEYEPALFGWPTELAGFLLVLLLGGILIRETLAVYLENRALQENILRQGQLLDLQGRRYETLREGIEAAKAAHHDLRHHLNALGELSRGGIEGVRQYLRDYAVSLPDEEELQLCLNPAADALLHYYRTRALREGIAVELDVGLPPGLPVPDADLGVLFGNCLENALEACMRQEAGEARYIRLKAGVVQSSLVVVVRNSHNQKLRYRGRRLLSSKRADAQGIGLESITALAARYGGEASFNPDGTDFVSRIILPLGGAETGDDTGQPPHIPAVKPGDSTI